MRARRRLDCGDRVSSTWSTIGAPGSISGYRDGSEQGELAAHELHAIGAPGVHERLQDRHVLGRRLDGDEMAADADHGDAVDASVHGRPTLAPATDT
jgi:hypothetical protein